MTRRSNAIEKEVLRRLPPAPGADAHARLMKRLSKMSAQEIFQTSVDAGIHNPDGSLTKHYRTPKKRK